ncbi:MAG: TldD/PmbA family protein [Actinobacteria bacterium]|nr:MAG: TldD/PmbA family protein [Actinomycetota bacterium]
MRDLTDECLNHAQLHGASYADVRIEEGRSETIVVKNGRVEELAGGESYGFGVRVIVDGAWGFAASHKVDIQEIDKVAELACEIARASATIKDKDVELSPVEPVSDAYRTPLTRNPFEVPLEEKLDLLHRTNETMRANPEVKLATSQLHFFGKKQTFASTEGSFIEQEFVESGGGIQATAIEDGEIFPRSYPNSGRGDFAQQGYEFIEAMDLDGNAERVASEAAALVKAKPCPSGETSIILSSDQLALQVHESCGHPTELDRVLGMEASFAGTSFLTMDRLGSYRYGSDLVTIVADATVPGALGTFAYDDEGVPAQCVDIVRDGIFVGYQTSRETAPVLGQSSNGTMRADGWKRTPLIRMTNINLLPGDWSLANLIADTDDGILFEMVKSWSIDEKRLNFQFQTEIGWEIKGGKLGAMIRTPNYTGTTPEFWAGCDAICNGEHWKVWGVPNCGKGEPMQIAHVGHGTAPARFRNVRVGVGR